MSETKTPERIENRVRLRDVLDSDLPLFFDHQQDPHANKIAAFTSEDPADRAAFDAHWQRIRSNESIVLKTILFDENIAGYLAKFERMELPEVSYWLGKAFWGVGVGTAALAKFIRIIPERPLYARVAKDNFASERVLEKCGFSVFGYDKAFAHARGEEIEETIFVMI